MSEAATTVDDKYRIASLEQSMQLLLYFTPQRRTASLEELHQELQVNKTQLTRMLRTFEALGFIEREKNEYRLGVRVLELSRAYLSGLTLTDAARAAMGRLAAETRHTVSLAVLDGLEVVYVAIEQGWREVGIQTEVGGRHPAHATALGKVLLASLHDDEIRRRYKGQALVRLTHRTIGTFDELMASVAVVRQQGYAIDDEERGIGIRCIAAPVLDHNGTTIAGISLAAPIFHLTTELVADRARLLKEQAAEVSKRLGFTR